MIGRSAFNILSVLVMIGFSSTILAGERECQERRADKRMEEKYHLEPKSPPLAKYPAPFDLNTPYGKIKSSDIFRDLAGNYCDSVNNLPAIYASGYEANARLTVVGPGFEKIFPIKEYQQAFAAYLNVLKNSGYKAK